MWLPGNVECYGYKIRQKPLNYGSAKTKNINTRIQIVFPFLKKFEKGSFSNIWCPGAPFNILIIFPQPFIIRNAGTACNEKRLSGSSGGMGKIDLRDPEVRLCLLFFSNYSVASLLEEFFVEISSKFVLFSLYNVFVRTLHVHK